MFLVCFATIELHAQCDISITGRIVDEHDGSALSFASICIESSNKGTMSDDSGNYTLEGLCPDTIVLVCAHLGCETIRDTLVLTEDLVHDFNPEHHTEMLEGISVVEKGSKVSGMQTMSTLENPELHSGESLGEMLEDVPGLNSLSTGGAITKPMIHGLHSNRLLIWNNGVRQEGQQWGNEHAPELDPAIADEIQVIKGPAGVQYGPDAVGGVILIMPNSLPDKFGLGGSMIINGQLNGLGGSSSLILEGRSKKWSALRWRVQGSGKKIGDLNSPDYVLSNTGAEELNFSYAMSLTKEKAALNVFYSQFNTNLGILGASHIGNFTDLERAFNSSVPLEIQQFSYEVRRPYQHVEHELVKVNGTLETSENGKLELTYARQYNLREEFDRHRLSNPERPGLQFEIVTHSLDATHTQRNLGKHRLKTGISGLYQVNTFEGRFFIPGFRKWTGGLFAIDRWTSGSSIFEAGGRLDYVLQEVYLSEQSGFNKYDHRYLQPSLSLGLSKLIGENGKWKLNAGTCWRPPNVNELYSNGLHHGAATYEIGNRHLQAEVSYSLSSGFYYQSESWKLQVEPYVNYMRDFINLIPSFPATLTIRGAFPTFEFQQIDALLCGLDIQAEKSIVDWLKLKWSASILRARDLDAKDWLVQMPTDRSSLALSYEQIKGRYTLKLSPQLAWVNKQWRVPPASDYVAPPDGFFLVGFQSGVKREGKSGVTFLNIEINNLLNERYRIYLNRYRYFADEVGFNLKVRVGHRF